MGFDGNMAMGDGAIDLGGLAQGPPQVTTQIITAPLHTEAVALDGETLELNLLVSEGGEFLARTYRLGKPGIEQLRAALAAIDGVPDA